MIHWTLRSAVRGPLCLGVRALAAALLLSMGDVGAGESEGSASLIGATVVTRASAARLKVGSHHLGSWNAGTVLSVEREQGGWLWVRAGSRQGWILRSEVTPLDGAIDAFSAAIGRDPRNVDALIARGVVRQIAGDAGGAIADFDAALAIDPGRDEVYNNRGVLHLEGGELDRAIADFGEAIRTAPHGSIAPGNRASAYARKGDLDRALADYNAAIRLHRDVSGLIADSSGGRERGSLVAVKHLRGRGEVLRAKRQYDPALADFTEAILLDPADPASYLGRGIVFGEKGQFGQAIADLTEAIRLAPGEARAYKSRGYFRSRQADYDRAIADFGEAIRLAPDDAQAYLWRGTVLEQRAASIADRPREARDSARPGPEDSPEAALADFDEAIRLAPNDPTAYRCRAAVRARLGAQDQAVADLDAANRLDLADPRATGSRDQLLAVDDKG